MSLKEKIRNIFKRDDTPKLEGEKKTIAPAKWKYEDMILFAPSKRNFIKNNSNKFYIHAFDKNSNPIANETIDVKIGSDVFHEKTDENGLIAMDLETVKYGSHEMLITYPNGDYSQVIQPALKIRKNPRPKKASSQKPPKTERHLTLDVPTMKMYINNEGPYYARLRDKDYEPVAGEEVKFVVDEEHVLTAKTDVQGFARVDFENLEKGKHDIFVVHEESSKYDEVSKSSELEMLVREIDKEVVIDVQHLTMEFKVTKDKIDTLKEFIIRTLKRNKKDQQKIRILDDISFKVYKGDKFGILGFNGAGKSTLLKILSGIYEPTSGSITVKGKIAPLLELGAGFDKNYTGKNNIYLNGSFLSIDEKIIKEKYDEIVEFSELGEFINYPIKNYSSGMRSKLGFAIATQINPDILIVDEILSVGDIKFKKKSAEKINSMMEEGVTVLLVTHSTKQIERICDTCIWLENGKIKMYGPSDEVVAAYVKGAKQEMKNEKKKKKKKNK